MGLAASLSVVACTTGGGDDGSSPGSTAAGPGPALRAGLVGAPSPTRHTEPGSWAGPVTGTDAVLAVVTDGSQVMAYLCDSAQRSSWFSGDLTGETAMLLNVNGDALALDFADADRSLAVTFAPAEGDPVDLTLAPTPADAPVPLYRAEEVLADEEGKVLAGWVTLADGTQRGSITVSGAITTKVQQATVSSTTTTTAAPSTTTTATFAAPLLATGSSVDASAVVVPLAPALTVVANPITPIALGSGTPDRVREFVMVTLGDSFAAGEGTPNKAGDFDAGFGARLPGGAKETWSQKPPNHPEVEACHRSDKAAGPLVAADLQAEFPDVQIIHQSFACSGAQIENITTTTYPGADSEVQIQVTPQLQQLRNWMSGTGPVTFPGTQKRIDAVYMNIGGNDYGFANVIASCIKPPNTPPECDRDPDLVTRINATEAVIDQRYADLRSLLGALTVNDGGTTRSVAPARIYLSQAPNPLRNENGQLCTGTSLNKTGGIANLSNITFDEASWVETNVVEVLNRAIARQSDKFTIVDTIPAASRTHGICSTSSWINDIDDALRSQGRDARVEGLPALLSMFGSLSMSSGMVHPNAAGYRGMADEIKKKIRPQLVQTFPPSTPGRFRVGTATENGDIELRWDDTSGVETRFEIEEKALENGQLVTYPSLLVDKNKQSIVIDLLGGPYTAEYRIRACGSGQGANACSPWSDPLSASNVAPANPSNVTMHFATGPGRRLSVSATDNSGAAKQGGRATLVLVGRPPGGGAIQQFVVKLPGATTFTLAPPTGSLSPTGDWEMSVRACNAAACGPEMGKRTITVVPP